MNGPEHYKEAERSLKAMADKDPRTDAEILTQALELLNYGGDEPFVNMATCCVCSAVQELRLLAARIGAHVPESVWS